MKYSFTKALILRPQAKLLVLINSQLPDFDWRSVAKEIQDLTAYILPDFKDDIEMLVNLEDSYLKIFKHELAKMVGSKNSKKLSLTFFDFLNCFKFEWHDDAKLLHGKLLKRVCVKQKNIAVSAKIKNVKTLNDICNLLDEINNNLQIIPVKNLSRQNLYLQIVKKLKRLGNYIIQQLKHSCNWHLLSHAVLIENRFKHYRL